VDASTVVAENTMSSSVDPHGAIGPSRSLFPRRITGHPQRLHHQRPSRAERDNAHEQGRCEEHDVLRFESENERQAVGGGEEDDDWHREGDRRERGTDRGAASPCQRRRRKAARGAGLPRSPLSERGQCLTSGHERHDKPRGDRNGERALSRGVEDGALVPKADRRSKRGGQAIKSGAYFGGPRGLAEQLPGANVGAVAITA
jgi:hypothetical protein